LAPTSAASGVETETTPFRKAFPVQEGGPLSSGALAVSGNTVPGGTPGVSGGRLHGDELGKIKKKRDRKKVMYIKFLDK
jgi:hypothetical protein